MQNRIKRILVTGGTGFIGRHLIDRLARSYEVVAIVRDTSYRKNGVEVIHGDITDRDCINRAMINIDAVVHLAATLDPFNKDILKINVGSTKILIEEARNNYVGKFIFISTENALYDFKDMYSTTKKIGEKLVKTFENYLILRPTLVYGQDDERFIRRLVDIAERYWIVPIPGNGKKLFQPIYVEDVVSCIENGLKYDVQGEYIVAGPSKISYDGFVKNLLKELVINKRTVHIPVTLLKLGNFFNKRLRNRKFGFFQIKSLEIDKVYDIEETVQALKYKPTPFKIGIRKTVKSLKRNTQVKKL